MPGVRVKEEEPFESVLKRFKKQCEKAGILSEIRKREHYEKPSVKRKKKALAARKRALKKMKKMSQGPMGLKERIQADMQTAAKEKNSLALSALRMALAAIKNKEIEARGEIGEDSILKVLATMVKQRKESIDLFRRGGREDLAGKEAAEIVVLEAYLPKALSGREMENLVREAIGAAGG